MPAPEGVSNRLAEPHQEAPTAITSSSPDGLHYGAEDVHPHAFADAAEHHARDEEQETERHAQRHPAGIERRTGSRRPRATASRPR